MNCRTCKKCGKHKRATGKFEFGRFQGFQFLPGRLTYIPVRTQNSFMVDLGSEYPAAVETQQATVEEWSDNTRPEIHRYRRIRNADGQGSIVVQRWHRLNNTWDIVYSGAPDAEPLLSSLP